MESELKCQPQVEKSSREVIGNSKQIWQAFLVAHSAHPLIGSLVVEAEKIEDLQAEPGIADKACLYFPVAVLIGYPGFRQPDIDPFIGSQMIIFGGLVIIGRAVR